MIICLTKLLMISSPFCVEHDIAENIGESDELVRTVKGETELTEDEWVAKLRKMKEET